MNERIKELLEQATDTIEIVNEDSGITHNREFFDKEKFAELVVKECVQICEQGTATQTTSSGAASMIKQHFGVE